jgi:hypothetical protein
MKTKTDLEFVLDCLEDVLLSCNDRCVGGCNCDEIYDKAVAIVTQWDKIIKAGQL